MRVLVGPDLDPEADLATLYAAPADPWLRVNMVETLDGAATGESGRSGSINNAVDKVVYHQLRALADAIVVGAGTARIEGYAPVDRPTVVVSRRGQVPDLLRGGTPGAVLLATCAGAELLDEARALLGDEHVLVLGADTVDLAALKDALVARGLTQLLCEGGPHLLRDLVAAGVADELCATIVPRLVGGEHPRITQGPPVDVPLRLHLLLEAEGTLLGRWTISSQRRGV
ncbi:dihydrofolate reductase family protein [Nocardioides aquiterrae]|uniref:Dihydrofolate reductase family protein n=1 Tax=Nocardioides aquiterrae TaxID=203799 RepID=A0ABP4EYB1_9ACTN